MVVLDALMLLGVLLVALVLVRQAARWVYLRRERKRHAARYYWEEKNSGPFADAGVQYRRPDR